MRNFKIIHNEFSKIYYIVYELPYSEFDWSTNETNTCKMLSEEIDGTLLCQTYEMGESGTYEQVEKYNGEIIIIDDEQTGEQYFPIHFKTELDAQRFMDDVLIPYEIAYSINGTAW